jgi:hypothetical protein
MGKSKMDDLNARRIMMQRGVLNNNHLENVPGIEEMVTICSMLKNFYDNMYLAVKRTVKDLCKKIKNSEIKDLSESAVKKDIKAIQIMCNKFGGYAEFSKLCEEFEAIAKNKSLQHKKM